MTIKTKPANDRGFLRGTFKDHYGAECSIQKSSLATEDCIWLGVNDLKPQIMASDAKKLGLDLKPDNGWCAYPIPDEVCLHNRMHLTQDMVKDLLPLLTHFAETGELP